MSRKVTRFAILLAYCLLLIYRFNPVDAGVMLQTIPTRTATPSPAPPTEPPTDAPPPASATPVPPTATLTPTSPAATATRTDATPSGGILPTAVLCGDPPTVQTQNIANVRQGPGLDYVVKATLPYLTVRRIEGRPPDAEWWLIEMDEGELGWLADEVVSVQGYIGNVPLATPSPIDGQTPTPGSAWNPTPNPLCTVTPTATMTPTPRLDPGLTETAIAILSATETQAAAPTAGTPVGLTPATASLAPAPATETPTISATATESAIASTGSEAMPTPTLGQLGGEEPPRSFDFLLPVGAILLAAGIVLTIRRRSSSG